MMVLSAIEFVEDVGIGKAEISDDCVRCKELLDDKLHHYAGRSRGVATHALEPCATHGRTDCVTKDGRELFGERHDHEAQRRRTRSHSRLP
jgi:hypothetical protein